MAAKHGPVLVVGLGLVGSALAKALIGAEYDTLVWNRTIDKAAPLVELGARVPENFEAGVAEVGTVVVCIRNYDDSTKMFGGFADFSGKT